MCNAIMMDDIVVRSRSRVPANRVCMVNKHLVVEVRLNLSEVKFV